jgi:hypothetical protein
MSTFGVLLVVPLAMFCGVLSFALLRKGYVRAGARIGKTAFFIEAKEKENTERATASGKSRLAHDSSA